MAIFARSKYLRLAKGFRGRAKNCPTVMMPKVEKALQKSYKDRKRRPREYRRQWISSINAGVREHQVSYSRFIYGLNRSNITLNRKILANLAINEPFTFKAIVDEIKSQKNLELIHKDDMDFIDAIDRNYLVYGDVRPAPEFNANSIPYIQVRPSLSPEEKAKIKIINPK